jgi:hypothetical protein
MNVDKFEDISLVVCISGLVLLMAYIVYDLAKKSNAGKFGGFILFGALGLGVFGFLIKAVIVEALMKK